MIKVVFTDIDGTILKNDCSFSEKTRETIQNLKKRDIKTVLATGRMFSAALPIAKDLGIDTPIICYQGAFIKDIKENKVLRNVTLDEKIAKSIVENLKEQNFHINLYMNDQLFVENDNNLVQTYCRNRNIQYNVKSFKNLVFENVHKILVIDENSEKIFDLTKKFQNEYSEKLHVVQSTDYFCEISDKEANKGACVQFLLKHFNIKKENSLAIGDMENDIDLLRSAQFKVAMGNACESLKKEADFVTKTVDNDGFAFAIQNYIS